MSDRTLNVRFFEVRNLTGDKTKFSECLEKAFKIKLDDREVEVDPEMIIRLERLGTVVGGLITGQFVRR